MYPLNMTNAQAVGYAVANDAAEHQSLSDAGYEPKYVALEAPAAEPDAQEPRRPGRPRKVQ